MQLYGSYPADLGAFDELHGQRYWGQLAGASKEEGAGRGRQKETLLKEVFIAKQPPPVDAGAAAAWKPLVDARQLTHLLASPPPSSVLDSGTPSLAGSRKEGKAHLLHAVFS